MNVGYSTLLELCPMHVNTYRCPQPGVSILLPISKVREKSCNLDNVHTCGEEYRFIHTELPKKSWMSSNGKLPLICLALFSLHPCGPQLVEQYLLSLIHLALKFSFLSHTQSSQQFRTPLESRVSSGSSADRWTAHNPGPKAGLRDTEVCKLYTSN